jgi:hypothetical protein
MIAYNAATLSPPFHGISEHVIHTRLMQRFEFDPNVEAEHPLFTIEAQKAQWETRHPLSQRRPDIGAVRPECPAEVAQLIERCWSDDPFVRPPFDALCKIFADAGAWRTTAASPSGLLSVSMLEEIIERYTDKAAARVIEGQNRLAQGMHDLAHDVATCRKSIEDNRKIIIAGHKLAVSQAESPWPWLFIVFPDQHKGGGIFHHPRRWLRKPFRIHLLCNGLLDRGRSPHFLFSNRDELLGDKCGYLLLQPTEALQRWGPLLRVTVGAMCLAAKAALGVYGISTFHGVTEGLMYLFEDDEFDRFLVPRSTNAHPVDAREHGMDDQLRSELESQFDTVSAGIVAEIQRVGGAGFSKNSAAYVAQPTPQGSLQLALT